MANQANYAERIPSLASQRPFRPSTRDHLNSTDGDRFVFFATHPRDNIEFWIYNTNGVIVGNVRMSVTDDRIAPYTIADGPRAGEYLSIDLDKIIQELGIPSGRYSFVANIFRDEIGSLTGEKLVVETISPTRTELRLRPSIDSVGLGRDIYEFTTPSVPRVKAQALLDQIFGKEVESDGQTRVNAEVVRATLNGLIPGTELRLSISNATESLNFLLERIKERTYNEALRLLREDSTNYQVQEEEFVKYIELALDSVLSRMEDVGEIDPRLELI